MTFLLLLLLLVAVAAAAGAFRPAWYSRRPITAFGPRRPVRRVVEEIVYDEPVEVVEVADGVVPRPAAPRHRRRRIIEY